MLNTPKLQLLLKTLIIISALFLTAFIFFQKINLNSLDLGRHIKNGELVWQNPEALYVNFYSYTEPDFAFLNHHWLSGVIFYCLFLLGGFSLLSIFNIFLAVLAVLISWLRAARKSNFIISSILLLPVILIMSERTDVRPEMFSLVFLALVFYLLDRWRKTKNNKLLYPIIPLQLVWINLHIYFFLGLFILGLAFLEQIFLEKKSAFKSKLFFVCASSFLASLINPHFFKTLLYPFNIMREYGYEIAENKSPFYLEKLMIDPNIFLFKFLAFLLVASLLIYIYKKRKINIFYFGIATVFLGLGFFAIRNLPVFALMTLPIVASNFNVLNNTFTLSSPRKRGSRVSTNKPWILTFVRMTKSVFITKYFKNIALAVILFFYLGTIIFIISDYKNNQNFWRHELGLGLTTGSQDSAQFYTENNLKGPIFNNYDFGSALIFNLAPDEKIFVDNRPEAYSADFFKKIYKPMQESDEKWEELRAKYKINLIYFSHTDSVPWAREFLAKRLNDRNWPLVYFDQYVVIMAKDSPENQELIAKYKIDQIEFEEKLTNLVQKSPFIKAKLNLASLAILKNRANLALEIYEKALENHPKNYKILASLGFLLSHSSRPNDLFKALNYLESSIKEGYKLPGAFNQMGLVYWKLQNYSSAQKMWENALKIDSKNARALSYLEQMEQLKL